MANTFETQIITDGRRNAVLKVFLGSDGAAGELSDAVLVDVSTLVGAPSKVVLNRIRGAILGFEAVLEWDATVDVPILAIPSGLFDFDFKNGGGLSNNAGAGVTGDILITTAGFTAVADRGWILLEVTKD